MPTARRHGTIVLLVLMLVAAGCFEPDRINGGSMYNWYSVDEDVTLGEEVMGSSLAEGRAKAGVVVDEAVFHGYVKGIAMEIAAVSHYPEFPWEVHTMNADVVNAWCAPGGKIMVYSGLFTNAGGFVDYDDPHEVAAVLGHEIAHATCRHVTCARSWQLTVWLSVFPVYLAALIFVPELTSIWDLTFEGGFAVWAASYSRDDEAEADRIGAEYAARAGYDPRAAITIWERAHELYGSDFQLLGSHPPNEERAAELAERMPELVEIYERVDAGWSPEPYPVEPEE
jgi:predicted Zn-dependent protease